LTGALDVVADPAGLAVVEVLPVADTDAGVVVVLDNTGPTHLCWLAGSFTCRSDRFFSGLARVEVLSWSDLDFEVGSGGCVSSGRRVEWIHFDVQCVPSEPYFSGM
jgi:hypothetical protein